MTHGQAQGTLTPTHSPENAQTNGAYSVVGTGLVPVRKRVADLPLPVWERCATIRSSRGLRRGACPLPVPTKTPSRADSRMSWS